MISALTLEVLRRCLGNRGVDREFRVQIERVEKFSIFTEFTRSDAIGSRSYQSLKLLRG